MGEEEEDVLGPRNNQNKGRGTLEEAVIFPPPPIFHCNKVSWSCKSIHTKHRCTEEMQFLFPRAAMTFAVSEQREI